MLSRAQQILLKTAQRAAAVGDDEYRDTLQQFCGVRSSTDPALGDDTLDVMMAYFEAIHWRGVDAGLLQPSCKATAPFRQRGYWSAKNPAGNTSRDRFTGAQLSIEIQTAEDALHRLGFSLAYVAAIRKRVLQGRATPPRLRAYLHALEKTRAARQRQQSPAVSAVLESPPSDPAW